MHCIVEKLLLNGEMSHNVTNAQFEHRAGKQEKQNIGQTET